MKAASVLGIEIHVTGETGLEPQLWCANHISWLDVIVLSAIGRPYFVSKAEVKNWPLIGWVARAAGTLFLSRGSGAKSLCSALSTVLSAGKSVVIFPEGTTTSGTCVRPFHPRLFQTAIATQSSVKPIRIAYLDEEGRPSSIAPFIGDDALVPHLIRVMRAGKLKVDVHFLASISPFELTRKQLAQKAHDAISESLETVNKEAEGNTLNVYVGPRSTYSEGI